MAITAQKTKKTSETAPKSVEFGYSNAERRICLCKSKRNTLFVNMKNVVRKAENYLSSNVGRIKT